jgi:hypothetical protein
MECWYCVWLCVVARTTRSLSTSLHKFRQNTSKYGCEGSYSTRSQTSHQSIFTSHQSHTHTHTQILNLFISLKFFVTEFDLNELNKIFVKALPTLGMKDPSQPPTTTKKLSVYTLHFSFLTPINPSICNSSSSQSIVSGLFLSCVLCVV